MQDSSLHSCSQIAHYRRLINSTGHKNLNSMLQYFIPLAMMKMNRGRSPKNKKQKPKSKLSHTKVLLFQSDAGMFFEKHVYVPGVPSGEERRYVQ